MKKLFAVFILCLTALASSVAASGYVMVREFKFVETETTEQCVFRQAIHNRQDSLLDVKSIEKRLSPKAREYAYVRSGAGQVYMFGKCYNAEMSYESTLKQYLIFASKAIVLENAMRPTINYPKVKGAI